MRRGAIIPRRHTHHGGFTTLEVLMALVLVTTVVMFTGRVIVTTFALIGRGECRTPQVNCFDGERAARARSQAVAWIQAATEYSRKVGFDTLTTSPNCCSFWISTASAASPYDGTGSPSLPAGFECGHLLLSNWNDPTNPPDPNTVRLLTVEIFRVKATCADGGAEQPYVSHQTAVADR
jgi:hypothetical protein